MTEQSVEKGRVLVERMKSIRIDLRSLISSSVTISIGSKSLPMTSDSKRYFTDMIRKDLEKQLVDKQEELSAL